MLPIFVCMKGIINVTFKCTSFKHTNHCFMFAQMFIDMTEIIFHLTQCMHIADMKMWLTDLVFEMTGHGGHGMYVLGGYSII